MSQKIYVIAGPTASGKSAHALSLAEGRDAVIINADSQQVYRDVRILTARPTPEEEACAPHKLYGFVGADENFSAGKWLRLAKMEIDWALAEGKTPIVVGGTGLYLKALMQGIAEIPDIDTYVRTQAENDYAQMGKEAFAERLRHVDPAFFTRLSVVDKQRLIRAYAVWLGSGKPLSYWQQQVVTPLYPPERFSLEIITLPRPELYARCDARVLAMIEEGAVEEVRSLPHRGRAGVGAGLHQPTEFTSGDGANNAPLPTSPLRGEGLEKIIGVRELTSYIRKEMSLETAVSQMQQATRNYAKRQVTWFRHQLI